MFDPDKVETARALQAAHPGWFIWWSPGLRAFTAIACFIHDRAVVINKPDVDSLLQRIGEVEIAASVGAPIRTRTDGGAQCTTEVMAPNLSEPRAVRPHLPRGLHSPRGGRARGRGGGSRDGALAAPLGERQPIRRDLSHSAGALPFRPRLHLHLKEAPHAPLYDSRGYYDLAALRCGSREQGHSSRLGMGAHPLLRTTP